MLPKSLPLAKDFYKCGLLKITDLVNRTPDLFWANLESGSVEALLSYPSSLDAIVITLESVASL